MGRLHQLAAGCIMPTNVFVYRIHAKEHFLLQGLAGFRVPGTVKGVLAMLVGQAFPHHVHHAEVIAVELAVIPTGIDQDGPVRPDFPVRIKRKGPRLAVCQFQVVPVVELFPVPGRCAPEDGQIRQLVFQMDLIHRQHIVNGQISFVYMDIAAVGPKRRHMRIGPGAKAFENFRMPYLSVSFKDFWSRWHITLTNWFRDYLYFTLGGNRKGKYRTYINVLIVFAVSGLWHGASWNFFIWGLLNGIYLAIFDKVFHLDPKKVYEKIACCLVVFFGWTFSLAFFRGANLHDALQVLGNIGFSNADTLYNFGLNSMEFKFAIYLIAGLMLIELLLKNYGEKVSDFFFNKFFIFRWAVYIAIPIALIYLGIYGEGNDNTFIYFQF